MSIANKTTGQDTELIEQTLQAEFPNVEAYRYNIASIRVRVVDERFRGKSKVERYEMVMPLVRQLPEEIQTDITLLLLLTEDEREQSVSNFEFENPTPTSL